MGRGATERAISAGHDRTAALRLDRVLRLTGTTSAELAKAAGVSEGLVSRQRSAERAPQARLVEALPCDAKRAWLRLMARELGVTVAEVPARRCEPVGYLMALGRLTSESGDVLSATSAAIADGHVSPDEAAVIVREAEEAMEALGALQALARRAQVSGGEHVAEVLAMVAGE